VQTLDSESQTGPNITKNMVERFEGLSTSSPRQPHALSTSRKSPDKQPWLFDPKAHDKPTPPHLLQYPATPKLLVNPSEDSEAERPPLPQRREWHVQPKLRNPASEPITQESATTGLQTTPTPNVFRDKSFDDYATKSAADIIDLAKTVFKSDYLCSHCETFPFDDCSAAGKANKVWSSPLRRMILHRNGCRLCDFLVQILCRPENDPFQCPQVSKHLTPDTERTMQDWLDEGKANALTYQWPFGLGESIELEEEDARGATNYIGGIPRMATKSLLLTGAIIGVTSPQPRSKKIKARQERRRLGQLNKQLFINYLPCFLEVHTNPLAPGLLDANLQGYGRGAEASRTILSRFRLKIGSDTQSLTESNSPLHSLSYGNVVDPSTIDLAIGRVWLQHCEREHGARCSEQGWAFITEKPTFLRVIDVKRRCLAEIPTHLIKDCRYVALSYVWGKRPKLELNKSNRGKLMIENGLAPYLDTTISNTVRDAIKVTDAIGERYLWVDALCISQNNDKEKQDLIDMMDRVYANAILTIVAANGEDAYVGLPGVQPRSRKIVQICREIHPGKHLLYPLPEPMGLEASPWNSRAWTMQERFLSRRLLVFLGGQAVWHCRQTIALEDMMMRETGHVAQNFEWFSIKTRLVGVKARRGYTDGSIVKQRDGRTDILRSETFTEYAKLVKQYTSRKMSYASDTLKALAGLLHILEACFKCQIKEGLPEILLDAAILWRPMEALERRPVSEVDIPSWSWAGWKGKVRYDEPFRVEDSNGLLEIVEEQLGQEHFRPLLRWYVYKAGQLKPLNGNALGIPLAEGESLPVEWDQFSPGISQAQSQISLSPEIHVRLTEKHLVFRTSCTTQLIFGEEVTVKRLPESNTPRAFNLIDREHGFRVGIVELDGSTTFAIDEARHEFCVISEAQYLRYMKERSREAEGDDATYLWYNVMLIEWDQNHASASRLGLGWIKKEHWKQNRAQTKVIVLG
jgi:hypothetical protein